MPITSATCPNCSLRVKLKNPIAAGGTVKCPKCATTFLAEDEQPSDAIVAQPAPRSRSPIASPRKSRQPHESEEEPFDDGDDIERPQLRKKNSTGILLLIGFVVLGTVGVMILVLALLSYKANEPFAKLESLDAEDIKLWNDLETEFKSMRDRDSAKQAVPRIESILERKDAVEREFTHVYFMLTPEQQKRYQQAHQNTDGALENAGLALREAWERAEYEPTLCAAISGKEGRLMRYLP